jgi:hypothetical protein
MNVRQRALVALVAVFLFGCFAGAGSVYLWLGKAKASDSRFDRQRAHLELSRMLQLSPDQETRFGEIMDQSRRQFEAARAEMAPKFQAMRTETNKKILAILNDDQKKKFEAFLKERDARRKEREPH